MKKLIYILLPLLCACSAVEQNRQEQLLEKGWFFSKGDFTDAAQVDFDHSAWQEVEVPHDWAIYGPFDRANDLQVVAITQNNETVASEKTGRTGGLPYVGVGWYRTSFDVADFDPAAKSVTLYFDGAMSEPTIYVNGKKAYTWAWGYNSFHFDATELLNADGKNNVLAVRLENKPESSRWYSGAGIYRNVRLITTDRVHIPVWGTYTTTPEVSASQATVRQITQVANHDGAQVELRTVISDADGKQVSQGVWQGTITDPESTMCEMTIESPQLWSPESPYLYTATTSLYVAGELRDSYKTTLGVRTIEYTTDGGFKLNGIARKFKGVCNHHDLGPLGAAINTAALRHQLTILKDMGCDAIRTAHNMPATELVELCDSMGFMVMVESFDEWDVAKCKNGYHRFFEEWAERDLVNMVHHFRNNPSVVMWSIGNEVPTQHSEQGRATASMLQDICHREDPTRPVTCGMDQVAAVLANGFAEVLDIVGLNYRTHLYQQTHDKLPNKLVLGSETSSTVSSRGVYKFPVENRADAKYDDHQSSSYDNEYCYWSNIPDEDFALSDDKPWTIGQFVWTGFDYLGEPSPYDTDAWPNHSSMFGIVDLASLPKDRYWLYRSIWNTESPTLHVLPHWTWDDRVGQTTPVFVYTSYPSAELFVNGKSYGVRTKNDSTLMNRYRLMWMNPVYAPGELKVVAYDDKGAVAAQKVIRTAGKAHKIELSANRAEISADGKDLSYITVSVVDAEGNPCPTDSRLIKFNVSGKGKYKAGANGDPTSLDLFHLPQMPLFSGQATAIVQSASERGKITLTASAEGVQDSTIEITTK